MPLTMRIIYAEDAVQEFSIARSMYPHLTEDAWNKLFEAVPGLVLCWNGTTSHHLEPDEVFNYEELGVPERNVFDTTPVKSRNISINQTD